MGPLYSLGLVSAKEKQTILATFKKWDAANTGYISEDELRRVLTALGVRGSQVARTHLERDNRNILFWILLDSFPS